MLQNQQLLRLVFGLGLPIQLGVIVSPRGSLIMAADIFWSQLGGCYWHLVSRDQGHCSAPYSAQDGPLDSVSDCVSGAVVGTLVSCLGVM